MNCLGLDYGLKHVGVALATGPLAEPLTTLPTKSAVQLIKQLVDDNSIRTIIIGRPDKKLKKDFEEFIKALDIKHLTLNIVDETLSSHDSRQSLLHTSQKRRKTNEHAVAAAIILQSWLDSNLSPSVPLS